MRTAVVSGGRDNMKEIILYIIYMVQPTRFADEFVCKV